MKINGGCFCGSISYQAEIDPDWVGICHCRDCQIVSGSAFRTSGLIPPDKFEFTSGTPKLFEKIAESGKVRRFAFCGECGSHLCSLPAEPESEGAYVSVRVATAEQFSQLQPRIEVFCSSKVEWLPALQGTTAFEKMPVRN